MLRSLRSLLFAIPLFGAAVALACGGTTAGDGSGGGTTQAQNAFCNLIESYENQCGGAATACAQAIVSQCGRLTAQYSDAYLNAAVACQNQLTCTDGGTSDALSNCLKQQAASAPRSAAQSKLAADYCASCSQGAPQATCESTFYTGNSAGTLAIVYSDAIINQIDGQCAGAALGADAGPLSGCNGFLFCVATTAIEQTYAPPECLPDAGSGFDFDASHD
jgi:hypothetical protein